MKKIYFKIKIVNFILLIFFLDYYTKFFIKNNFKKNQIIIVNFFLNILYKKNYGLVFEIFSKQITLNKSILYVTNSILFIITILVIYITFKKKNIYKNSFILFSSGSVGNIFERIKNGYITDFIDLHYKNFHFFIFNISDIFITLGFILFFLENM
ncbi:MAG: signal peptidase II [Buchnera aphidicola (Periphyllus lyropictus)]|uniref:signal peptidase II n=1 Tax=Buchnera aphidicola TaxID=9 RepID=UPI001ECF88CD|nr:signal peptidase II [Buchnera aphidicola]NIH16696.1 signal peptidase II [Buchnera aphidicola (Periphyllus lyropictus)]USS94603.1 signal peptidase II [Buchnera aphidicola (Periphyllus lyropictus)]